MIETTHPTVRDGSERARFIRQGLIRPFNPDAPYVPHLPGTAMTAQQLERAGFDAAADAKYWEARAFAHWQLHGCRTKKPQR